MGDFQISQMIKLILGIFVVVLVVLGVFFIFKNRIISIFGDSEGIEDKNEKNSSGNQVFEEESLLGEVEVELIPIEGIT